MNLFQFTPQAEADLIDIWSYIASDNLESAGRVENAIYEACAFIADGPMPDRMRQDLGGTFFTLNGLLHDIAKNAPINYWFSSSQEL